MGCDFSSQPDDDDDAPTSPLDRACGVSSQDHRADRPRKASRLEDPSSSGPRLLDSLCDDANYDVTRIDDMLKDEVRVPL